MLNAKNFKGVLIAVEGPDGAGKGMFVESLLEMLNAHKVREQEAFNTRQPGGTPYSEAIRRILKDNSYRIDEPISSNVEMLLFNAGRLQANEALVIPALERGDVVVTDRNHMSTHVYQGNGNSLTGIYGQLDAFTAVVPDLTIILLRNPKGTQESVAERGEDDNDAFERGDTYREQVYRGYKHIIGNSKSRESIAKYGEIIVVNTDNFDSIEHRTTKQTAIAKAITVMNREYKKCQTPAEWEQALLRDTGISIRINCDSDEMLPAYRPTVAPINTSVAALEQYISGQLSHPWNVLHLNPYKLGVTATLQS